MGDSSVVQRTSATRQSATTISAPSIARLFHCLAIISRPSVASYHQTDQSAFRQFRPFVVRRMNHRPSDDLSYLRPRLQSDRSDPRRRR